MGDNEYQLNVDAAVRLNYALWKLRKTLSTDVLGVMAFKPTPKTSPVVRKLFQEFWETHRFLQTRWPALSKGEIIDVALTITQAASVKLSSALQEAPPPPVSSVMPVAERTTIRLVTLPEGTE